jgi:hypothetical protein
MERETKMKPPIIRPNMTLLEIVEYHHAQKFPHGAATPAALTKNAEHMLEADDLSLLSIGIRRVFANHEEAEAWDAAEPQRNWDDQVNYIAFHFDIDEIDANYPFIVRTAVERCDAEGKEIPEAMRAHAAEVNPPPVPAVAPTPVAPKRRRLCFERQHLGGIEFKVWDLARAYWVSSGECWLSSRNVAKQCNLSRDTAKKYIRRLIAEGWFEVLEEAKPGTTGTAKEQSARYRQLQHSEWIKTHSTAKCL